MPEDVNPDVMTCPSCEAPHAEDEVIVDVDFEFQGKIPILVVYYRCPSCNHGWTDAHEPLNRPDLPGDSVQNLRSKPMEEGH